MLYYLFNYLEQLDFPGARMFGYVSFRSLMAIILRYSENILSSYSSGNKLRKRSVMLRLTRLM